MDNLITLAPAVNDTGALFQKWQQNHAGTVDDFYRFISTPSPARSLWLLSMGLQMEPQGDFLVCTYSV